MDCPTCSHVPLEEKELSAGLLFDVCPKCEGVWLDSGELEAMGSKVDGYGPQLAEAANSAEPTQRACPNCRSLFNRIWIAGAEAEPFVCPQCKGTWMASDGFHKLRSFLSRQITRPQETPSTLGSSGRLIKAAVACLLSIAGYKLIGLAPRPKPSVSRPEPAPAPVMASPEPQNPPEVRAGPSEADLRAMIQAEVKGALKPVSAPQFFSDVDVPDYALKPDVSRVALVVGVEKYPSLPAADFGVRDAVAVRDHLLALGFAPRNIMLLTDADATKGRLTAALNTWLPQHVTEGATIFFYYSGHGASDPTSREAYLVPADGVPEDLPDTAFALKQIYAKLTTLKARDVIVAIDSCFSGLGGRSVIARGSRPFVTQMDLNAGRQAKITVLSASGPAQISGTLTTEGHGVFTYFLLKGLNGAAIDGQGRVTVSSLYQYLKPEVEDAARMEKRDQTPQLMTSGNSALVLRSTGL